MEKISFKRLKFRRLSEMVEESIRDLIFEDKLRPGSRLPTEKELSKQFGVSIVTIREALKGLESFGIIEKKRGREGGIFITQANNDFIKSAMRNLLGSRKVSQKNISEIRKIIEPTTAKIAASRITSNELKNLEKNVKYCENKLAKKSQNYSEADFLDLGERNMQFHRMIAEATHNPILSLMVDYLMDFLFNYRIIVIPDVTFSSISVRGHRAIYDAVKRKDAKAVERCMLQHIKSVEHYLAPRTPKFFNSKD